MHTRDTGLIIVLLVVYKWTWAKIWVRVEEYTYRKNAINLWKQLYNLLQNDKALCSKDHAVREMML